MKDKEQIMKDLRAAALQMRKDSLYMAFSAGNTGAHLGGGLSMIEIMAVLYLGIMKYNISQPTDENRDRFILSKGHGVLALYAAMKQIGLIQESELTGFKSNHTHLTGHPSMNVERGIEFSSGSLGQGLSLGVGTAIALKRKMNSQSRVFVLLGDGECDEGSVWEAAMSGANYKLDNLVAIIDRNHMQYDGDTECVMKKESFKEKWSAFGWEVRTADGHDVEELYDQMKKEQSGPVVIIAETVKGKGISFMENNAQWHHGRLSEKQYAQALAELEGNV